MNLNKTGPSVDAFFESYRAAFERFDAPAVADHFAYPSHITSDAQEITLTPIAAKADWVRGIERLLDMYRVIGLTSARVLDLTLYELSPRLVQASVQWEMHDGSGNSLYDFHAIYTLVEINDALRISAISHNEMPRYRACLVRLQAQRERTHPSPDESAQSA
jgi:hypothetical protein